MEQAQQYAGSRNLGMVAGNGNGMNQAPQPRTLAARLEATAYIFDNQCRRIEDTLAKVNGTPRAPGTPGDKSATIAVTAPLSQSVEALEQQAKRLTELANLLEQVA